MIKYVKGDVLRSNATLVAHGCNCRGGFGSGVALAVANKYPKTRRYYLDKFNTEGWELGDVQFVRETDNRVIANCATQDAYLPRGRKHADYPAIRKCMQTVKEFASANGLSIAIPKIGAGLAGGNWVLIEKILQEVFTDYDVTVYYLE